MQTPNIPRGRTEGSVPLLPARLLLGWFPAEWIDGLASRGGFDPAGLNARADQLRAAVADRPGFTPADPIVGPLPPSTHNHAAALQSAPAFAAFATEGWEPVLADLRRVVAAQPQVYAAVDQHRLGDPSESDPAVIIRHSLPLERSTAVATQIVNSGPMTVIKAISGSTRLSVVGVL